jgi:hypothetical protein
MIEEKFPIAAVVVNESANVFEPGSYFIGRSRILLSRCSEQTNPADHCKAVAIRTRWRIRV